MTVAHFYIDTSLADPHYLSICGGTVAIYSAPRSAREAANQDSALSVALDAERGILAVADGAGGLQAGGRASTHALRQLLKSLRWVGNGSLREAILHGFDAANQAVAGLGVGAATTVALVLIDRDGVRSFHAGDSLVMVVGQRGKRKLETIAHSPVGYAVEAGVLDEDEAMHHEERHLVSNLVGTAEMRVEMSARLPLARRDTVLLASDGLSDNLNPDELVELIRKGTLEQAASGLIAAARERMKGDQGDAPSKPDDLTFLLYRRS